MLMLVGAANRDPRRFGPDSDVFDIHREPRSHMTFGAGTHFCMGNALARLEGRIALEEILKRFPEWEVDWPERREAPRRRRCAAGNPCPPDFRRHAQQRQRPHERGAWQDESKARSHSSPARHAARAARTRCGWRRRAPTSSRSTSASRSTGHEAAIPPSTPEDLAETADLVKNLGRRIVTAEVDVRDYDALKDAVDSGVEQLGRLDIIVANAGIGNGGQTLDKTSEDDWTEMIDINLSGVWKAVKAGVPHILAGGNGGSIVLTSSVGGLKAYPHTGHYVAAKHGVVGLMRTFAVELGAHNIRVNSVHPTNVNTPLFLNEGTKKLFRPDLENPTTEDMKPVAQFMHVLPIGWVEPEDIANAVLFLSSDEARYITGVTLPIDAGSCLK